MMTHWEGREPAHWQREWGVPRLEIHDSIGSTNDRARELADDGAPGGTVVLADLQTVGRGRQGRRWHAPSGTGLLLSMILRPDEGDDDAGITPGAAPLRIGLAVARAVERNAPIHVKIKWPNDLVAVADTSGAHGRTAKLAGILCEAALTGADPYVVAGIGINVSQQSDDLVDDVRNRATSVALASGRALSRSELAATVIGEVRAVMRKICRPLNPAELTALSERDVLLGNRVAVAGAAPLAGVACGIEADGALKVREESGRILPVYHASVRRTNEQESQP